LDENTGEEGTPPSSFSHGEEDRVKVKKAKVTLIDYTGKGMNDPWYAASLMIWTKRTRTEMSPGGLEEIMGWPEERKLEELAYMAATVPSSWEFCDFTFLIENVTRAFTHQLVRTRTASYAQQAMQVLRMDREEGWTYHTGLTVAASPEAQAIYDSSMRTIAQAYSSMLEIPGIHTEDARGVLPTNIQTNIVVKANLRSMADLLRKRASPRNQGARPGGEGEWSFVHRELKRTILEAMPWAELFLNRTADVVAADAYKLLEGVTDKQLKTNLTKCVDQLLTNVGAGDQ
jgi:flavin-dependent thymidylate synthase